MRRNPFDLGLTLTVALAAFLTANSVVILLATRDETIEVIWPILAILCPPAAWNAVVAWWKGRWLLAAASLFLSLASPVFLWLGFTGPITLGLVTASLLRARGEHRAKQVFFDFDR